MPKPGPRTTTRYSAEFKAVAVCLSQLPGVQVKDVAESLYIPPFMLSRWRKETREDAIMTKGITVLLQALGLRPVLRRLATLAKHYRKYGDLTLASCCLSPQMT